MAEQRPSKLNISQHGRTLEASKLNRERGFVDSLHLVGSRPSSALVSRVDRATGWPDELGELERLRAVMCVAETWGFLEARGSLKHQNRPSGRVSGEI